MISLKANKIIEEISASVQKNGIDAASLIPQLKELRELARQENDPLLTRSIRMAYEHLENNDGWEFATIKPEEDEEGNPLESDGNTAEEHFDFLLTLWAKSDNKYNRDEMRTIANELNEF